MRKILLTILIVILGIPILAQEISFPSAIVSAGGGSEGNSLQLSRWRLAPVHVITLSESTIKKDLGNLIDWRITPYPNPVTNYLNLEFDLPEEQKFIIKITDVSGRVMFIQEPRSYIDGDIVELDFADFVSSLYLVKISSPDLKSYKVFRIQKL